MNEHIDAPAAAETQADAAGKIMLVGIGPGSVDHMTQRARAAIAEADVVIGYVTYIKLVADLIEGKEIIRKSMTEELDRAVSALEAARAGKKVALISSGDAGVYGMAGPTYEVLFQAGWTPSRRPISSSRCTTRRAAGARARSSKRSGCSCATAGRTRPSPS
jgi:precorrin-3B C17-methyltransferase